MRDFTRLMLSAYPRLPRLLETIDHVIRETAVRSFYEQSGALDQMERMARKLQLRAAVSLILKDMEDAVASLSAEERKVLTGRYFGTCLSHAKGEYPFSKTTYYRKLKKATDKVEEVLKQRKTERVFRKVNLQEVTFFRYLSEHLKEARRKENGKEKLSRAE